MGGCVTETRVAGQDGKEYETENVGGVKGNPINFVRGDEIIK